MIQFTHFPVFCFLLGTPLSALCIIESGETIKIDTLWWIPPVKPSKLIQRLVENLNLELDEQGNIRTDERQETNVKGLFAAGDIQGWGSIGALTAAYQGGMAAVSMVHEWYD